MTRLWNALLLMIVLAVPISVQADSAMPWVFHSGATGVADGLEMPAAYYSTIAVQIEGSFVGELTFQKKTQDATGWAEVQCMNVSDLITTFSTTETGYWDCPGGAWRFRVAVTSYTSGTIVVTGTGSTAVSGRRGGGGIAQGLDPNFDWAGGNVITGTNEARRFDVLGSAGQIDNGATIFQHSDGNTYIDCVRAGVVGDCHKIVRLSATRYFQVNDSADAQMVRLDPGAASAALKYTLGTNHKILHARWVPAQDLVGDGAQCPTSATVAVLGSGPRVRTFICNHNNASRLDGSFKLPYKWDTGSFTVIHVVAQTATDTNNVLGHITCQVRGINDSPNSSWATEVAMTTQAMTGSGAQNFITISNPITCDGTPAPGDMLYFKYELDAAGTTTATATLHHLGFLFIFLTTSLSE